MPAKAAVKGRATSVTVRHSNGRRTPSCLPKAAADATSKTAIRNVGNAKPKKIAPVKATANGQRTKVKKYSYNMPKSEHSAIVALKEKLIEQGVKVKKSELIRAGIRLLVGLSDARIKGALEQLLTVAPLVEKSK